MSDSFETSWTLALEAPLSMGFSRQEFWSGLPFPSPGHLPDPGVEPGHLPDPGVEPVSLSLAGWFFTTEPPGKPIAFLYWFGDLKMTVRVP